MQWHTASCGRAVFKICQTKVCFQLGYSVHVRHPLSVCMCVDVCMCVRVHVCLSSFMDTAYRGEEKRVQGLCVNMA